ncbi:hypothetical protein [Streptomyces puniciscabiei]|uniref:hypothetical protein n=1 Tax=Streptomyces puniciscabiei TaxID=164348 RepID=UPI00332957B2
MRDDDVDEVLQRALDRLTPPADATSALASTLDVREGLRRVCRMAVPQVGDWCAVDLVDEQDHLHRVCVAHRIPAGPPPEALEGCLPPLPETAPGPLARVLRGAGPLLLTDIPAVEQARNPLHARQLELFKLLAADTAITAPLRARRQVVGEDGLVERRGEPLDHGLTRLRRHAAALAREPLDVFCDELLTGPAQHSADDIALLALRLPGPHDRQAAGQEEVALPPGHRGEVRRPEEVAEPSP